MKSLPLRRVLVVLGAILLFGAARLPLEQAAWERQVELGLRPQQEITLEMQEELGQNAFAIALGGYRAVVATWFSLLAFDSWDKLDWAALEQRFRIATTLQPQEEEYWRTGGWHLAYNASADVQGDLSLSSSQREFLWQDYIERGSKLFEDGARQNPDSWRLWRDIGMLWRDRFKIIDTERSLAAFEKAAEIEGAPQYLSRFLAYEKAHSESAEHRREALEMARKFWQDEKSQTPRVLLMLYFLEHEVGDPERYSKEWFVEKLAEITPMQSSDRVFFVQDYMNRSNLQNSPVGQELVAYYQELAQQERRSLEQNSE